MTGSEKFCAHQWCISRSFPSQQRRDSSKFCGMFWVTNSERVIDETEHGLITHECLCHEDRNISAVQVLAETHFCQNGLRGDMPPYVRRPCGRRPFAAVPKATFSFAMALMDKVGGWNEEQWEGSNLVASCGSTPKTYCAMGADVTRLWTYNLHLESSWKE